MIPSSTYRLQLNAGFTFRDTIAIVPYLADLGVSHVYASPILRARPGSSHGYDIIDHNAFNPEIGSADDFAELVTTLRAHRMGLIVDFVPNHVGIGPENLWWLDVLEWGEISPYASYFDIDWRPLRASMRGKVLLPFLGSPYGEALAQGRIELAFERPAGFVLRYFDQRFPISPPTYPTILQAASSPELAVLAGDFERLVLSPDDQRRAAGRELVGRLTELAEQPASARSLEAAVAAVNADSDRLDQLIGAQNYRPAYWRVAGDEINYRRFFDINNLAALRMENAQCFADTHRLIFELLARGDIDGLRIDHIDGLFDPIGYCDLLRSRAELLGYELYLVVEKILARHETLRERWRIDGTTGYEYLALVTGLLVDGSGEERMERAYRRFTGREEAFADIVYRSRRQVMDGALAGELNVLAEGLDRIAQSDRMTRDYTREGLRRALEEVIACFPVYRTYARTGEIADEDRRDIDWAIGLARTRDTQSEPAIYDFIAQVLKSPAEREPSDEQRARIDLAMRFQQYTAPLAAKGVEDTAFYRYHRLLANNEVGSDPARFATSVAVFHKENADRSRRRPHGMLTTATHDTKRGEDVRARLAVLSEMTQTWDRTARRWAQLNARRRTIVDGEPAPSRDDEYLLYQTLVGAWPIEVERLEEYAIKALREAKVRSSWTRPNTEYEAAVGAFLRRILDASRRSPFLEDLERFVQSAARLGMYNSLTQTVLRLMGPGVPDTYRGCELWALSLVDPDNRRPVDYGLRAEMLATLRRDLADLGGEVLARRLLAEWDDGRIKLFLTWRLLQWRLRHPEAFEANAYRPLETTGRFAECACAFMMGTNVVVVSRLTSRLPEGPGGHPLGEVWGDTGISVEGTRLRNVLTGASVAADQGRLAIAGVLRDLTVAVLEPEDSSRNEEESKQ